MTHTTTGTAALGEMARQGRAQHGDKWDPANLGDCPTALAHYRTGVRVRVTRTQVDGESWTRTGTIGKTTGWRPVLLLMHRSSDHGSSDVLGALDVVTAVKNGRGRYVPVV